MKHWTGWVALIGALNLAPAAAVAQHAMQPKHELGADIVGAYEHQSLGGVSDNQFIAGTPVDFRIGFMAGDKLVVEPRFFFRYSSKGGFNTSNLSSVAAYVFTPDVNFLVAFRDNKKGPYVTVGVGADLEKLTQTSTGQLFINGGLGTRVPYESGAIRLEAFGAYAFKNETNGLPNTLQIGARIGLSLWH
ncbi:MAG TPA: hypothetical protein VM716_12120 [Gemmatimonadales bacterium]|nr:hypothetical protein [Gemmatimonadales bacterium]